MHQTSVPVPIRLGLIGCGGIVHANHIPVYRSLANKVRVTALADLSTENLARAEEMLHVGSDHHYRDYREMLAREELDAVTIATPHSLHARQAVDAAEAGVAIVSEKPMATTLEEADSILDATHRHRVPYAVVHNLLFTLPMQSALGQLREGRVGTPIFGRGQLLALKPADLSAAYHDSAQAWRASRAAGGGCLIDTAYHEIYSVEALMGSPIRYVEARVKTMLFDIDVDDLAMLLFEHENGAVSTVSATWCAPAMPGEGGRWCEVHTSNGSLRVHHRSNDPLWQFYRDGGGWGRVEVSGLDAMIQEGEPSVVGHKGFFAATFDALAAGAPMPVNGETAYHTLAVVEAARQASEQRQAIEVKSYATVY